MEHSVIPHGGFISECSLTYLNGHVLELPTQLLNRLRRLLRPPLGHVHLCQLDVPTVASDLILQAEMSNYVILIKFNNYFVTDIQVHYRVGNSDSLPAAL